MNVYQPLRRSVAAIAVTLAVVAGTQAMARIGNHADATYASTLPTIASVSVAPTCVAGPHSSERICYQANVIVGEPERLEQDAAR